jgi:hypothetical protein
VTPATPGMDCQEARLALGVYVLGAIEPADRALVDRHLATCRDCRDELAALAGLPALLARVSAGEALALAAAGAPPPADQDGTAAEPPPELLGAVLDLTAARRRRRRWREAGLGIAAALIIAAGVFGGLRAGTGPAPAPVAVGQDNPGPASGPWQTLTASAGGMSAAVSYRPMGWGTQLAAKVSGIPVGTACQLWVLGRDGKRTLAGSWVTDAREGTVWYPASASVTSRSVRGFQITVGSSGSLTLTA